MFSVNGIIGDNVIDECEYDSISQVEIAEFAKAQIQCFFFMFLFRIHEYCLITTMREATYGTIQFSIN